MLCCSFCCYDYSYKFYSFIYIHILLFNRKNVSRWNKGKLNPVKITAFWYITSYSLVDGYLYNSDNVNYYINSGNGSHYSTKNLRYSCLAPRYGGRRTVDTNV